MNCREAVVPSRLHSQTAPVYTLFLDEVLDGGFFTGGWGVEVVLQLKPDTTAATEQKAWSIPYKSAEARLQ